ncbi:MAG TPA: DUF1732 domain-containing protein, partial [Methylovirgula sp.]
LRINEDLLRLIAEALAKVPIGERLRPASLDGILNLRGVVELREAVESEAESTAAHAAILAGLEEAISALVAMRRTEGLALAQILTDRVKKLVSLQRAAEDCPGRKPEAIKARLKENVAALMEAGHFDETRLYQEAVLLAAKADVREEMDRLGAHLEAVSVLLHKGGPVGRRLDFLAQELGREANTLCAKSNDAGLTSIGLELRVEIEQFREQIQNIE